MDQLVGTPMAVVLISSVTLAKSSACIISQRVYRVHKEVTPYTAPPPPPRAEDFFLVFFRLGVSWLFSSSQCWSLSANAVLAFLGLLHVDVLHANG